MQMIRIVNPRPGSAPYTSIRAAMKYVRRKIARFTEEGELFFFNGNRSDEERKTAQAEVQSKARRLGKIVFWNGEDGDPLAIHRPGEVRC